MWLDFAETASIVATAAWAIFVYARSRRGEVRVAIEHAVRLKRDFSAEVAVLIVELTIRNSSDVLWRRDKSRVTLFDARRLAPNGSIRLMPFAYDDPFLPLYGADAEDPNELTAGRPFSYFKGQEVSLEPGETVTAELAFRLNKEKLGLMAVKVWLAGYQGRWSRTIYEWATFFYVDPDALEAAPRAAVGATMEAR